MSTPIRTDLSNGKGAIDSNQKSFSVVPNQVYSYILLLKAKAVCQNEDSTTHQNPLRLRNPPLSSRGPLVQPILYIPRLAHSNVLLMLPLLLSLGRLRLATITTVMFAMVTPPYTLVLTRHAVRTVRLCDPSPALMLSSQ